MECQMNVINCPHEQIAGHLADGHTRISRKPTVCLVGPEGIRKCSSCNDGSMGRKITSNFCDWIEHLKREGSGGFKEIDDVSIAKPLTKFSVSISDGERISEIVDKAYRIATNGYPGAVHISLPVDIMFSSFNTEAGLNERPYSRAASLPEKAWPDPQRLKIILDDLRDCKRPIIIGGHGVWWSNNEKLLEEVGEKLSIPIFNVPYHQKLLGEESYAYMGLADVHQYHPSKDAFNESDIIIMIGGDLTIK